MSAGLVAAGLPSPRGGVSFTAPPGTVVALAGGPGRGKSRLLAMLAGLEPAPDGAVLLDGRPPAVTDVGVMPQPARLVPELTATENVAVPLLARGRFVEPALLDEVFTALLLPQSARGNLVEQLSGGQQQRVAVARALVTRSPLVCLDEPVTELDPTSVEAVWAAVLVAAAAGAIVVIATADRELAARCDLLVDLDAVSP